MKFESLKLSSIICFVALILLPIFSTLAQGLDRIRLDATYSCSISSRSYRAVLLKRVGRQQKPANFNSTISLIRKRVAKTRGATKVSARKLLTKVSNCKAGLYLSRLSPDSDVTPTPVPTAPGIADPAHPSQSPIPTPFPTLIPTLIPTHTATPIATPTPTPIDICVRDNKKFLWGVGSVAPLGGFDVSASRHIQQRKVVIVTMNWFGGLPQIADATADNYQRADWMHWPYTTVNGKILINTGTPLYGDIAVNEAGIRRQIDYSIPDVNYDGYIVFDSEMYFVSWDRTFSDPTNAERNYLKNEVLSQYRLHNPGLTDVQVLAGAKALWEQRTVDFYRNVITYTRAQRPHAKLGWYETVERAYHSGYGSSNGDAIRARNDISAPIHQVANFVVASIYQFYRSGIYSSGLPIPLGSTLSNGTGYFDWNRTYVQENVGEARRIADSVGGNEVVAFDWSRYHDGGAEAYKLVNRSDMFVQLIYPLLIGADSVVIWGNETTWLQSPTYRAFQPFISDTIAPMIERYCVGDLGGFESVPSIPSLAAS